MSDEDLATKCSTCSKSENDKLCCDLSPDPHSFARLKQESVVVFELFIGRMGRRGLLCEETAAASIAWFGQSIR